MCRAPATMSVTAASISFARICAPTSTASRCRMSSTGIAGIRGGEHDASAGCRVERASRQARIAGDAWLRRRDGDAGCGNALAVQKTIRAYARRGAAAVLIEDKAWPRPLGHQGAKLVIERDSAILRCRAAVEACREEGILLLARTDARVSRGFEEALARLKEFVAAGADILFLDSPQSEAEMCDSVAACSGKPALAVTSPAGKHFMPDNAGLQRLGIRLVVYPQEILAATVHAIRAALGGLKGGAKPPMATPAELATAIRAADYLAWDARWPDPR